MVFWAFHKEWHMQSQKQSSSLWISLGRGVTLITFTRCDRDIGIVPVYRIAAGSERRIDRVNGRVAQPVTGVDAAGGSALEGSSRKSSISSSLADED